MIFLDIFPDIVGAVSAADLLAASLTGNCSRLDVGEGKTYAGANPLVRLALAVTGLGILVLVAIALQHRLGRWAEVLQLGELSDRDSSTDCHAL